MKLNQILETDIPQSKTLTDAIEHCRTLADDPAIPGRLRARLKRVMRVGAVVSALEDVSSVASIDRTQAYWALQAAVRLDEELPESD